MNFLWRNEDVDKSFKKTASNVGAVNRIIGK